MRFDSIQEQKYEVSHLWLSDLNLPVDAHGIVEQKKKKKSHFRLSSAYNPLCLAVPTNKKCFNPSAEHWTVSFCLLNPVWFSLLLTFD